ncbi:MAG: hypothetical protein KDH88_17485 [Chromatiales bacterium]|nr:hypothetical protein [Chromatiales bacterium]
MHNFSLKSLEFYENLARICKEGRTGTVFVTSDDQRSIRLGLNQGKLSHCAMLRAHGEDAWMQLANLNVARFALADNANYPFQERDRLDHDLAVASLPAGLGASFHHVTEPILFSEPPTVKLYRGAAQVEKEQVPGGERMQAKNGSTRYYRGFPVSE